jgi:hypothetical protein
LKKEAIKLLKQSLEKIGAKDFDLDSWKEYNQILLSRIFGKNSQKVKQIGKLDFEYNSWSLRDAIGNESYEDGTIKLAREIIQASIDEINSFGIPDIHDKEPNKELELVLGIVLDELKGSQLKQLKSILKSSDSNEEKKRRVFEIIGELGENTAYQIITCIITHKSMKTFITN